MTYGIRVESSGLQAALERAPQVIMGELERAVTGIVLDADGAMGQVAGPLALSLATLGNG